MRESVIGHCSYSTGHCSNSPGLCRPLGAGANYCYFLFLLHADHCRPLQSAECVLRAACRPVSWLQSQFLLFVPAAACRGSLLTLEQPHKNHLLFVWIHSTVSLLCQSEGWSIYIWPISGLIHGLSLIPGDDGCLRGPWPVMVRVTEIIYNVILTDIPPGSQPPSIRVKLCHCSASDHSYLSHFRLDSRILFISAWNKVILALLCGTHKYLF